MDGINVISINPGQTTKAAMHPEVFERIAREYKLNTQEAQSRHVFRDCVNFVLGLNGKISSGMSAKLLSIRLIMGAGIISMGIFASSLGLSEMTGMVSIIFGGLLSIGLVSRLTSTIALGYFGYIVGISAAIGSIDAMAILPALVALISMIMGPGFYSCDQLIRKSIFRNVRRNAVRKKKQLAEDRLSYKAFASTNYR